MGIIETVVRGGTANAKIEKVSGVDGGTGDGRRKLIRTIPSTVAPEIAEEVDVQLRATRGEGQGPKRRISAGLHNVPPLASALKRVTAAGSAEEKRADVIASGSMGRVGIEVHVNCRACWGLEMRNMLLTSRDTFPRGSFPGE